MLQHTTTAFAASIRRELKLRQEAYPKMMAKKVKQGYSEAEQMELSTTQRIQYELLEDALAAIEHFETHSIHPNVAHAIYMELQREMKCRKSYYGFLIWKKRLTKDVADYEKAVWAALIEHWEENYLALV